MASLESVLAGIPGIGGFEASRQQNQSQQLAQLQQMGALQKLALSAQEDQRNQAYRAEMASAKTDEERLAIALKHGGSKDVIGHSDVRARIASNKEMAIARLAQANQTASQNYQVAMRNATTNEQRASIDAWYKGEQTKIAAAASAAGVAKTEWETGTKPPAYMAPAPPTLNFGGGQPQGGLPVNVPPSDMAAYQAALVPGGTGVANRVMPPQEVQGMQMQGSAPIPAPSPTPAPQPSPQPIPARPNNLDARDLGAGARGPVMGTTPVSPAIPTPAPVTAPAIPPDVQAFAAAITSPRKRQEYLNAWSLAQDKKSEEGQKIAQRQVAKALEEQYVKFQNIPQQLDNIEKAKALVPQAGMFVGSLGEQKLAVAKFFNNNLGTSIDLNGVQSAEELRTRIFMNVMDNLKKMDAQPSQLQQQIMQQALGSLGSDPGALPRMLDAYADALRDKVTAYQTQVEEAKKIGINWPHNIKVNPKAGAIRRIANDVEYDALPSGSEFIDPQGKKRRKP